MYVSIFCLIYKYSSFVKTAIAIKLSFLNSKSFIFVNQSKILDIDNSRVKIKNKEEIR